MSKELIVVSGITGSGKTIYCGNIKYPVMHIDSCFNYTTQTMNYYRIKEWKDKNNQHEALVLDAYLFFTDPDLLKLKETILPIERVSIKTVYTTIEELYRCQRSTPQRIATKKSENLNKKDDIKILKQVQTDLMCVFTLLLEKNIIVSVEYIFREGSQYTITNKSHFLKTLEEG